MTLTIRIVPPTNIEALVETTETDVLRKPCGSLHFSENYGGNLMIVERHGIQDDGSCESAYLSADGRGVRMIYQRTPAVTLASDVYVERHDSSGCAFHGWVDPNTRLVVQAG